MYQKRRETELIFAVIDALGTQAIDLSVAAVQKMLRTPRRARCTLRPGLDTPLWNALVHEARQHLRKPGAQAQLARLMGVHRARVHEFFRRGTAMPDAERTLLLLQWLALKRVGREPA